MKCLKMHMKGKKHVNKKLMISSIYKQFKNSKMKK